MEVLFNTTDVRESNKVNQLSSLDCDAGIWTTLGMSVCSRSVRNLFECQRTGDSMFRDTGRDVGTILDICPERILTGTSYLFSCAQCIRE